MSVQEVEYEGQLAEILQAADWRLVVIDFYADWCGPCRMIAPTFVSLSNYYTNVVFVKVNVDRCPTRQYNVQAMPTFLLYIRDQEVERVQGANPDRLRQLIDMRLVDPPVDNPNKATTEERHWLDRKLVSHVDHIKQFEDEVNIMLATSVIPHEQLVAQATRDGKLSKFLLAKHLMDWFHGFFKWVDKPACHQCTEPTTEMVESTECTSEEKEQGGGRVEVFACKKCNARTRFVRYKSLPALLESRRGRCGEWADCFTLCCRAVELEARLVYDTQDHVWTEVFDPDRDEWIHLDACENVIDRPLLYEKGWRKKQTYVFAIAKDGVEDVTWRYTIKHRACLKRRNQCRERVLTNCIYKLNARLIKDLPAERKTTLLKRRLRENVRFLNPKLSLREPGGADELGRQSGSLEWRQTRGETHKMDVDRPPAAQSTIITPSDAEIEAKKLILTYDVVNNRYCRPNDNNSTIDGYESLLHAAKNLYRKHERDWNMVYLSRQEGCKSTDFSWKISFNGHKAKHARIMIGEFALLSPSARGMATVCAGDLCTMIESNGIAELDELDGAEYLELSINLRGGDGDVAWQHAQCFRTNVATPTENLRIEINFE